MFPSITIGINNEIVVTEGLIINKIKIPRFILDTTMEYNIMDIVPENNSYHRKY